MSQTQDTPPTERAEKLINRTGERIGFFAASSGKRLQELTVRRFGRANQGQQPTQTQKTTDEGPVTAQATQASQEQQPTVERAEEMVDTMGQRFSLIGTIIGLQSQRVGSRIREQFEDMWAEAQQIRHPRR
jgi:hypothetical protein